MMTEQIGPFLILFLSKYHWAFGMTTIHTRLLEKCKSSLDNAGAVLMDLSRAFDCLNLELVIAKLASYGFSKGALNLINSYLHEKRHRVKVNCSFSTWKKTSLGVPQGSVLDPLLFNFYINDSFYLVKDTDLCNYADDNTLFSCGSDVDVALESLERDACLLSQWLENY